MSSEEFPRGPVDFVYTWVDGADPEYARTRDKWASMYEVWISPERDRDHLKLLKYSLRSLEKFVDWHGRIFIVTARPQMPDWLRVDGGEKVRVVHHDEIFENPRALPTFNSFAIEHNLHRIEGLSRHFVYVNDDFLFGRKIEKSDFMTGEGKLKVYLEKYYTADACYAANTIPLYPRMLANTNGYLDRIFGRKRRRNVRHWPVMIDRQLLRDEPEIRLCIANRFRYHTDIVLDYAYCHSLLAEAVPKAVIVPQEEVELNSAFHIITNDREAQTVGLENLRRKRPKFICMNDDMGQFPDRAAIEVIAQFLEDCYPEKSSFEN